MNTSLYNEVYFCWGAIATCNLHCTMLQLPNWKINPHYTMLQLPNWKVLKVSCLEAVWSCFFKKDILTLNLFFFLSLAICALWFWKGSIFCQIEIKNPRWLFFLLLNKMCNLAIDEMRIFLKIKNLDCCQNISRQQLEDLFVLPSLLSPRPKKTIPTIRS